MNTTTAVAKKTADNKSPKKNSFEAMGARFCDGYGIDAGIFNVGQIVIQMRGHVWGIAQTVQNRMRHQWRAFAQAVADQGVSYLRDMDETKVRIAIEKIERQHETMEHALRHKTLRELFYTVNNVLGVLPLLKWSPIEYMGWQNYRHTWERPEIPKVKVFLEQSRKSSTKWIGKPLAVVNTAAAPDFIALGKEAFVHCYRGEISYLWSKTFKQAWRVFMDWCPHESTDPLTRKDIEAFAVWLVERAEDPEDPVPVNVAVASFNLVNDTLARLRGEHWIPVAQPFTDDEVSQVPHPVQVPVASVASAKASSATSLHNTIPKLGDKGIQEAAHRNYLLASNMLLAGQRIIKMRSSKVKSGYTFNQQRSRNWLTFCAFMKSKGVEHLSQLDSDRLDQFIAEQREQYRIAAIRKYDLTARISFPLAMLASIKPLQFDLAAHYQDNECIQPWKAPQQPSSSESETKMALDAQSGQAYFESQIFNFGLGYGVITPATQLALMNSPDDAEADLMTSCATTFAIYLKDAGLTQLEQATEGVVDDFLDQLEYRVENDMTTHSYAQHCVRVINTIMSTMKDGWVSRSLEVSPMPNNIDPTKTSVDLATARASQRRNTGVRAAPKRAKVYPR